MGIYKTIYQYIMKNIFPFSRFCAIGINVENSPVLKEKTVFFHMGVFWDFLEYITFCLLFDIIYTLEIFLCNILLTAADAK